MAEPKGSAFEWGKEYCQRINSSILIEDFVD